MTEQINRNSEKGVVGFTESFELCCYHTVTEYHCNIISTYFITAYRKIYQTDYICITGEAMHNIKIKLV